MNESRSTHSNKPYFSIVMPSYNQGKYINQAIKSVASQSYKNWELVINDGGSTDNTVKIIESWAKRYPNQIRWRSKKDAGQVAAINEGIDVARGKVIAYLNSDDYYLPGTFANIKAVFEADPFSQWFVGNCNSNDKGVALTFRLKESIPYDSIPKLLFIANFINQPAVFLRKKFVNRIGKFNERYHYAFDYDYWLKCIRISHPNRIRKPLAVFRIHSESKGNTGYSEQFDEDLEISSKHCKSSLLNVLHRFFNLVIKVIYTYLK